MQKPISTALTKRAHAIASAIVFAAMPSLRAQATAPAEPPAVFGGIEAGPLWIGGQANYILQGHGDFHSPYEGANSLHAESEHALSHVLTLYTVCRLSKGSELVVDVESAGGRGISDAFGIAGFTNLDVVRNPGLGAAPYLARLEIHTVVPLGDETESVPRGPLSGFAVLPARRLEIRAGKMGTPDSFDLNGVGSDSHLQFLNWSIDNNGAYDYAADTRGYTLGALAEYHVPLWSVRAGLMLMPAVANGIKLDHDVRHARGENLEFEFRPQIAADRATAVRLLLFRNLARMGSYREALADGNGAPPDITESRQRGRTKYGAGLNAEQELTERIRAFARLGWNDGRNESFAYTEVDRTAAAGFDLRPSTRRPLDKVGVALVANRISALHRAYLAAGGLGFLLGDGALRYGPERIVEVYYTAYIGRGVYLSADLQDIRDPGYNRDRGPVLVPAARLHVDF
ncbi:MAG TPA: carbohydrate porin [Thermoanaerobaculia bacterium]|jgi:high affinity Mn2+ porin|nr:carbohydrate porin [Thermoanaerobaculia bacterium]